MPSACSIIPTSTIPTLPLARDIWIDYQHAIFEQRFRIRSPTSIGTQIGVLSEIDVWAVFPSTTPIPTRAATSGKPRVAAGGSSAQRWAIKTVRQISERRTRVKLSKSPSKGQPQDGAALFNHPNFSPNANGSPTPSFLVCGSRLHPVLAWIWGHLLISLALESA